MNPKITELKTKSRRVRRTILDTAVLAGAAHIAPCFSCVEILVALYFGKILNIDPHNPQKEDRDRFILSKGHAALVLYVILASKGFFSMEELKTFTQNGSRLGCHPENSIPGVETFTGSLGHGLPIAAGLSLGAKLNQKSYSCFVLLGDGECHEGSIWEAAMFAKAQKLNNLVAIIDHNTLSATDIIENYLPIEPLKEKWEAFGWDVFSADGHSFESLMQTFEQIQKSKTQSPKVIIAATKKGKGISFMENSPIWHYRVPTGEELETAYREIEAREETE